MSQHTDPHQHDAHGHDGFDGEIPPRPVYWTGVVLIATALLAFAAMWALRSGMQKHDEAQARQPSVLQKEIDQQRAAGPPGPGLQPDPNRDMREMRAEEDQLLGSYGWADRASGVVRIPIARAVELVAAKGLGTRPAPTAAAAPAPPASGGH